MPIRPAAVLFTVILSIIAPSSTTFAGSRRAVTIPERFQGADGAVVARIIRVQPAFERNKWGDELIVSHTTLQIEETLKGRAASQLDLVVEGGTLDGLTLHVSDLPEIKLGDRAVFLLKRTGPGRLEPHLRGLGILLLDEANRVRGSSLSLDMIRQMARGGPATGDVQ